MATLNTLLHTPMIDRLGVTLLHSLWQGAAAMVLLMLASRAMRRASSSSRYLLSCGTLLALVLLPTATYLIVNPPAQSTAVAANPTPHPAPVLAMLQADGRAPAAVVPIVRQEKIVSAPTIGRSATTPIAPTVIKPALAERLKILTPWLVIL